jgi:RHS repeat-associated protein
VFGYTCQASGSGWTTDNATTYSYDLAGNRTSQSGTYGAANRITAFNGCTYATDNDGNVTSRTCSGNTALSATFTWTAEGLLKTVTNQGTTTTFQYDGAGRLVRRDVGGSAQGHYLWDGDNLLAELDGAGTTKLFEYAYYPGLDQFQALIQGTTPYFAHRDGLGNVIALTDLAKTVQRTYTYDDWGNGTGGTDTRGFGNLDRARWKGALWTSSAGGDLYYMRNRWYEPYSRRFLSEDPLGLAEGLNLYTYAGGDPANAVDPTGLTATLHCTDDDCDVPWWPVPPSCSDRTYPLGMAGQCVKTGVDDTKPWHSWPTTHGRLDAGGSGHGGQHGAGAQDTGGTNLTPLATAGPSCQGAIINALQQGLFDALVFTPFAAVRVLRNLTVAATLARDYKRAAVLYNEMLTARAVSRAAVPAVTGLRNPAALHAVRQSILGGAELPSLRQLGALIPIVATGLAIDDAIAACR